MIPQNTTSAGGGTTASTGSTGAAGGTTASTGSTGAADGTTASAGSTGAAGGTTASTGSTGAAGGNAGDSTGKKPRTRRRRDWLGIVTVITGIIAAITSPLAVYYGAVHSYDQGKDVGRQESVAQLQPKIDNLQKTVTAYDSLATKLPDTKAKITSLRSGAEIDQDVDQVDGTFEKLPQDSRLWLYVLAGDKYFLHSVTTLSNETWKVNNITVGDAHESGLEFKIGILVADTKADILISKSLDAVYYLPSGVTILNEIPVTRK